MVDFNIGRFDKVILTKKTIFKIVDGHKRRVELIVGGLHPIEVSLGVTVSVISKNELMTDFNHFSCQLRLLSSALSSAHFLRYPILQTIWTQIRLI